MKKIGFYTICAIVLALALQGCKQKSSSDKGDTIRVTAYDDGPLASFSLPDLRMMAPIEVEPADPDDSLAVQPMLVVANIGHFASVEELRNSYFYGQLCSIYPDLEDLNRVTVDTGVGDLWLFKPITGAASMTISEYNMQMFLKKEKEDDGKVYMRTKMPRPLLVKASMDDPGSIIVDMTDSLGRHLHWIPSQLPASNILRTTVGVETISYNPIDEFVEFGADYIAQVNEDVVSLRFYADRQVRLDNRLMRYVAFDTADKKKCLFIKGLDFEALFQLGGEKSDLSSFTLLGRKGYDFGVGTNKTITFKKQ